MRRRTDPPIQAHGGIERLRRRIDRVDDRILDLLNERAHHVVEIGRIKAKQKRSFHSPARECEIIERLTRRNRGPFPSDGVVPVFREILSASLALEKPLRVAFLGPLATFTHLACQKHFGLSAAYLPQRDVSEVFDEVERARADYGVVAIENSIEGVVSHTLDLFIDSALKIRGEIVLEISHDLLNRSGRLDDVTRVYSHPHALGQCRGWLREHLSGVPVLDVDSTALAAEKVAGDPSGAAIASALAARTYGLKVVKAKIQDNLDNFTRFLVVGRDEAEATGRDKTSILFSLRDAVGALYKSLAPFYLYGVNLTKIESRPLRRKPFEYVFFVDVEGHASEERIRRVLEELAAHCVFVKVLGSYPKADELPRKGAAAQRQGRGRKETEADLGGDRPRS